MTTIKPSTAEWFYYDLKADYNANLDQWREVTEENYDYGLNVLPPMDWRNDAFLVSEPYGSRGQDTTYAGFAYVGGRYFARIIARRHVELTELPPDAGLTRRQRYAAEYEAACALIKVESLSAQQTTKRGAGFLMQRFARWSVRRQFAGRGGFTTSASFAWTKCLTCGRNSRAS